MNIGEFVKTERQKLHLSQAQLADYAGVGLRFLRELEAGKATLQLDKVNEVLRMFNARLGVEKMEVKDDYSQP